MACTISDVTMFVTAIARSSLVGASILQAAGWESYIFPI